MPIEYISDEEDKLVEIVAPTEEGGAVKVDPWSFVFFFFKFWSCLLTRTLEPASSNLDRRAHRFNLRPPPRSTSRTCKRTERRRCGRSHSNA